MRPRFTVWISMGLTLIFIVGACAPAPPPTPELPPTNPPTLPPQPVSPTETPTLIPVALAGPNVGTSMPWIDGSLLAYIPEGEFTIGSGAPDAPERTVTLDDYWIHTTEVTNSMYAACVSAGGCAPPAPETGAPSYDNPFYANYPVVGVTWDMAANYCSWVGGSLPTEAQWEKAARGANGNPYPWGEDIPTCGQTNLVGCVGATTDVTRYADSASPYGVLDTVGNVFEWVSDWYAEDYYDNAPAQNPPGPGTGQYHVIRGSSFESEFEQTSPATRHFGANAYHNYDLGFRCAVAQPQPYAPICKIPSYVPSAARPGDACQAPDANVRASYCEFNQPFGTLDVPPGAIYEVVTDGYNCSEAFIDNQRRLTCTGPENSTGEITVCDPACSVSPDVSGVTPVCYPGYVLDPGSGNCVYAPVEDLPSADCPDGFVPVERHGQAACAPARGQDGECPPGLYFDDLYGACVSPVAGADVPYGLDDPTLASQAYSGCPAGFGYDADSQCCQAVEAGASPPCPLGTRFEASSQTCVPAVLRLSGPGCVTVSLNMLQCNEPFQVKICSAIETESSCIQNQVYDCQWNESANVCEYVK